MYGPDIVHDEMIDDIVNLPKQAFFDSRVFIVPSVGEVMNQLMVQ